MSKQYVDAIMVINVPVKVRASFVLRDAETDPADTIARYLNGDDEPGEVDSVELGQIDEIANHNVRTTGVTDGFGWDVDGDEVASAISDHLDATPEPVDQHVIDVEITDAK